MKGSDIVKSLLILGAGGFGRTVRELAISLGDYDHIAFLDDGALDADDVIAHCGAYRRESLISEFSDAYPAFGDNSLRYAWMKELHDAGYFVPTMIHPHAYISPSADIGFGVIVLPNAVINTNTKVEDGSIINIGALIDHDCTLGVCCHIAPGAIIKANNIVPPQAKVESGTVLQRK